MSKRAAMRHPERHGIEITPEHGGLAVITIHPGEVPGGYLQSMSNTDYYDVGHGQRILRHGARILSQSSPRIANARCETVKAFLGLDPKVEWAVFIDADMTWENDALHRMIASAEEEGVKILGGLAFAGGRGSQDMFPTMYYLSEHQDNGNPFTLTIVHRYPMGGKVGVDATGAACLLVHREVLERMGEHFKDHPHPWFADGYHMGADYGEDIVFCMRARQLGYQVVVDTTIQFGHVKHFELDEGLYRMFLAQRGEADLFSVGDEHVPVAELFDISGPIADQSMEAVGG